MQTDDYSVRKGIHYTYAVWLDPVPEDGDTQGYYVRRYIAASRGDFSFNRIAYRCGNIPVLNATDFDKVRFATDWRGVVTNPPPLYFGTVILAK